MQRSLGGVELATVDQRVEQHRKRDRTELHALDAGDLERGPRVGLRVDYLLARPPYPPFPPGRESIPPPSPRN